VPPKKTVPANNPGSRQLKTASAKQPYSHLLQLILENSRSGVAVFDREMNYLYVSRRFLDEYRLTEDVIGKNHYDVFPEIPQKWRDVHQRALAGEIVDGDDDSFERLDGTNDWTCWQCRPWYEPDGSIGGIVLYTEVVTKRKQAEEAIRQSEQRYRLLATATADVVYRMSSDWSEMLQLTGRGFIADTHTPSRTWLEEYIHTDDQAFVLAVIHEAIRKKSIFQLEHRVIRADGSLGWTSSRAVPLLDDNGEIIEWIGAASDITEQKLAVEETRIREERLRLALEVANMGTFHREIKTNEVIWSDTYRTIYGLSPEAPASYENWLASLLPEDRATAARNVRSAMVNHHDFEMEFRIMRQDGSVRWLHAKGGFLYDDESLPLRLEGVVTDVTERKQAEETLRHMNNDLEEANTALKVLLTHLEDERKKQAETVLANIRQFVLPYLAKIKGKKDPEIQALVHIIDRNLEKVISPFVLSANLKMGKLAPQELLVANLVREGKKDKEIAALLNLSVHTIMAHRRNIRKKLGLSGTKENLASYLELL